MPQTNDDDESENGRPLLSHFFSLVLNTTWPVSASRLSCATNKLHGSRREDPAGEVPTSEMKGCLS